MKNKIEMYRAIEKAILILTCLLSANSLFAADVSAQFRTGYGVSDNIARTSTGEIDEEMIFVGATISYLKQSPRLYVDIRASADYVDYVSNVFDDQVIGGFNGRLVYDIVPERLNWMIRDSYGQRLLDPLARPTPGNRENVNYFVTGPSLTVPLWSRNFFGAGAQYVDIRYEESTIYDNNRLSGQLQLGRQVSSNATISLNFTQEQTSFDNDGLSSDYDITNSFVRYQVNSTRDNITFDLGVTEVETDTGEQGDGSLARFDWTRFISTNSRLSSGVGSRYSDQGDIFSFTQDTSVNVGETVDTDGRDQPFRSNYVFTNYNVTTSRSSVTLEARWTEDDYEFDSTRNRDLLIASFFVSRDVTAKFFVNLGARFMKRDYSSIDRVDEQTDLTITFGYRVTPAFDLSLGFLRSDRESDVAFQEFTENRAVIQFDYTPVWGRQVETVE